MSLAHVRRSFAACVAALCWLCLAMIVDEFVTQSGSISEALWRTSMYFTNWTALLGAVLFTAIALGRAWFNRPGWMASMVVAVAIVLALYWTFYGFDNFVRSTWSSQFLHAVLPILVWVFWIAFTPHRRLGYPQILRWTAFPLLYVVYFVGYGHLTGSYAYDAANVTLKGGWRVGLLLTAVVTLILVLGWVIVAIDHMLPRRSGVLDRRLSERAGS